MSYVKGYLKGPEGLGEGRWWDVDIVVVWGVGTATARTVTE